MTTSPFQTVGVIGAGTMGTALSVDLALHGMRTVLIDITEERLLAARTSISKSVRGALLLNKRLPRMNSEEVLKNITFSTNISDVSPCEFIIENIIEDIGAKKEVYAKLEAVCGKDVCYAANTSCVSITQIGSFTQRADRVIGMHFMNPVYLKSCVEVIRGHHTSEDTILSARNLLKQLQKDAVVVNDLPGFVSNRVSHLFMNEAAYVVMDQVAEPKAVDEIFRRCYGHPMGPLQTADLIGLDTVVHSLEVLYESYQDSKFRCCPLLRKMVQAGFLGVKSGKGFYEYPQ